MRRALLIPILLTAAAGPYVVNEREQFKTDFASLVNQIDSWNSSSSNDSNSSSSYSNGNNSDSSSSSNSHGYSSDSSSSDSSAAKNSKKRSSKSSGVSSSDGSSGSASASSSGYNEYPSAGKSSSSSYSSSNSYASDASSSSGSLAGVAASVFPLSTASATGLTGTEPTYAFHEVLRFDVTPRWVVSHWPRITTVLAESELEGLRVALVSGTKVDDIAGSLTYYFDKQHKLQRLTFQGFTGDDRRIVQFVTQHYGFKSLPTLGAGLYLIQWNGKPRSAMRINHLPVVRATAQNMRLEIMLEINRPRNYYGISPEFDSILKNDKENGRW